MEKVILVDKLDNETGTMEKQEAHIKGVLHRAFSIFVFNSKIFEFIKDDKTILEKNPLEKLSKKGQLMAFKHNGFWQCMDTMRDKKFLTDVLKKNKAPWKN